MPYPSVGLITQIPVCEMPVGLWIRTLNRYTRAGLPECVVSTMSGPLPETTQDRTQTTDIRLVLGQKLKFLIPPESNQAAGLEGRDTTDLATATEYN